MIESNISRTPTQEYYDGQFAWALEVENLELECADLRWEQFVSGGITLEFEDGTHRYNSVLDIQKINPKARHFGSWSDDMLKDMLPGPRPVDPGFYSDVKCNVGVVRDARTATYRFADTAGYKKDFGDRFTDQGKEKTFRGIVWQSQFEHKVWRKGGTLIVRIQFSLRGRYDKNNNDTRTVEITSMEFTDLRSLIR
jgi:hypothetical protein